MNKSNRVVRNRCKLHLNILTTNEVTPGTNSLKSNHPEIWNIKAAENLSAFKTLIKEWNGIIESCNIIMCSQ